TKFQQTCQKLMLKGHDYGVIPGTQKPTLLKPGAEKITKILGLSDQYEVTQRTEDWDRGFFHYEVKCTLCHLGSGAVISEGLGSCNSMESKYRYRWLWSSDLPPDFDRDKAVKRWVGLKSGSKSPQFRFDNEDIYSQVNTLLKMAGKRSLVDAALHAGRLSDLFTQDIEDMNIDKVEGGEPTKTAPNLDEPEVHHCEEHDCDFELKHGRYGDFYSHPLPGKNNWCKEKKKKEEPSPVEETSPEPPPEATGETTEPLEPPNSLIDMDWLSESLKNLEDNKVSGWDKVSILGYMKVTYKVEAETALEAASKLDKGQAAHFVKGVEAALALI
ncbi:hypothetical protein LCGC14_2108320, partial [marine sediment metagenome]